MTAPKCEGIRRYDGKACQQPAVKGRRFCKYHGGNVPRGADAPNFKHGRYSSVMPQKLREYAEAALEDKELLATTEAIAAIDARLMTVFETIEDMAGRDAWREFKKLVEEATKAFAKRPRADYSAAEMAVEEMRWKVAQGLAESSVWVDIANLMEAQRRLKETEVKRRKEMEGLFTAESVMAFVYAVMEVVARHVADPEVLQDVQADLAGLTAGVGGRPASAIAA